MKKINIKPKHALLFVLFLLLISYSLFQARFLILGPQVWISRPVDGEIVGSPLLVMSGRARNAAWLSLDGRQIFTDENGFWEEKLIVSEGLSIMTVTAQDRFGRERQKSVRVILN